MCKSCRWRTVGLSLLISLLQMTQLLSLLKAHQLLSHPPSLLSKKPGRRSLHPSRKNHLHPPRSEDQDDLANPSQLLQKPAKNPEADRPKQQPPHERKRLPLLLPHNNTSRPKTTHLF